MEWYWHIECPLLSHFPHWRCPVNHAHIVTCWKLEPPRQLFICYFSSDIVATHQSVPICGDNKGGVTELVTVIRTKLWCHILLAWGGSVVYPGEGGGGELQSFYTVIVAVIIGVDRLLYLFVILILLQCSVQNWVTFTAKCWPGPVSTSWRLKCKYFLWRRNQ